MLFVYFFTRPLSHAEPSSEFAIVRPSSPISHHPPLPRLPLYQSTFKNHNSNHQPLNSLNTYTHKTHNIAMCLSFSTPKRRVYREEVYVAPRPVSRHSHHSHHHGHGHHGHSNRASYTSVTRTSSRPVSRGYVATPRMSQTSYRRSGPVVVEQRRSTGYYR